MNSKLAIIKKVNDIKQIEGVDNIELVIIDGRQCVSKKNIFNLGDLGMYFEIGAFLPVEDRYEFLRKSSYKENSININGHLTKGFKIQNRKICGVESQGLLLPMSLFPEVNNNDVGTDYTKILNIELYNPLLILCDKFNKNIPIFVPKKDVVKLNQHHISQYKDVPFECQEFLDGISMTIYFNNGVVGVCNKNFNLKNDKKNLFWKIVQKLKLSKILKNINVNIVLQGKLIGVGIRGNKFRLPNKQFFLFDVWDIDKKRYYSYEERLELFMYIRNNVLVKDIFNHIPVLYLHMNFFDEYSTMQEILDFAVGGSYIEKDVPREGIVLKSRNENISIPSFKVINFII